MDMLKNASFALVSFNTESFGNDMDVQAWFLSFDSAKKVAHYLLNNQNGQRILKTVLTEKYAPELYNFFPKGADADPALHFNTLIETYREAPNDFLKLLEESWKYSVVGILIASTKDRMFHAAVQTAAVDTSRGLLVIGESQ